MTEEYTDVSDSRVEEPQLEMVVNIKRSFWERWKGWFLMVIGMGIGDFIVEPLLKIFPDKNWLIFLLFALYVTAWLVIGIFFEKWVKHFDKTTLTLSEAKRIREKLDSVIKIAEEEFDAVENGLNRRS